MPSSAPSLYFDEDVSVVAAAILRARGFVAITARDTGQLGQTDAAQLAFAADAGRILLTHNRVHFEQLHREWLEAGRPHAGIIIARRRAPRELATRVGRLLARVPANQFESQVLYA